MFRCEVCGAQDYLVHECKHCGGKFCSEHMLPENHQCSDLPYLHPPIWDRRVMQTADRISIPPGHLAKLESDEELHFRKSPMTDVESVLQHSSKTSPMTSADMPRKASKTWFRKNMPRGTYDVDYRSKWRPRRLLLSLTFWFPVFWLIVASVYLSELANPIHFYQSISAPFRYVLYALALIIGVWSGWKVFKKCDYSPSSDRGIFGLKLLSASIFAVAIVTLFCVFALNLGAFFASPEPSMTRETSSWFLIGLSATLMILAGYLQFKFERRSGVIVYRR